MPTHPQSQVTTNFDYARSNDVCARARERMGDSWLWQGYLAPGNVTLLVGPWKAGKTTLLSILIARLGTGGILAGLPVRPGRAVVVSEEGDDLWAERIERLGLGDQLELLSRPFRGRPTPNAWQQLIGSLITRHEERSFDLLVIDPLAAFVPGRTENDAGLMLDVLLPLQALTRLGVAVLVLHHPSKRGAAAGRMARGTGALTGSVDVILELELVTSAADDDRRRRLSAYSRHRTTCRRLVIELTPDGADYVSLGDYHGSDFADNWAILSGVLEDAKHKLTRKEILAAWPEDYVKPGTVVLWRWLDRAVKENRVLVEGTGRRNHPFRYWLDGMEEVWASDPINRFAPLPELEPLDEEIFGRKKTLAEVLVERLWAKRAEDARRGPPGRMAERPGTAPPKAKEVAGNSSSTPALDVPPRLPPEVLGLGL